MNDKQKDMIRTIFTIILTISILMNFIILSENNLLRKTGGCVINKPNWTDEVDFLIPNILWLLVALGFVINGFKLVSISHEHNYNKGEKEK